MIKIGITGNIAAGKSQAERILEELGYKVIDCDKINNRLLIEDAQTISLIKTEFGSSVFDEAGCISKQKLAEIVFKSRDKKLRLEEIMYKPILREVNTFFDKNKNETMVFVSAALLFEAGWQNFFDKVIFVSAEENIRLERLMKRNGFSKLQAQQRINAQSSEADKIKKSDFVIYNNSNYENLKKSVQDCINYLNFYIHS